MLGRHGSPHLPVFRLNSLAFFFFLLLSCRRSLYTLDMATSSGVWLADIFSSSVGGPHSLTAPLAEHTCRLMQSRLPVFLMLSVVKMSTPCNMS